MKVCWVSDWTGRPATTGFSRASRSCLQFLHEKGHEIHEVAVGYQGEKHPFPWKAYPTTAFGGRLEGQDVAPLVAKNVGADILVLFMDIPDAAWAVMYADKEGRPLNENAVENLWHRDFALALYAPIDGMRMDGSIPAPWPQILHGFNSFDALASPSRFGQKLMGPDTAYVPHGVDPTVFVPMDRDQCRNRFGLPQDRFTILYVGVNKRRKAVPAFFEAVSKFMDRQPGAKVTAFFVGGEREDKHDIQGLVDSYRLEERGVIVFHEGNNFTDAAMPALYGCADLQWHPGSEGFGIPIAEAAACRIPTIVVDFAGSPELVPDAEMGFCKVPVQSLIPQPYNNIAWAWPDTDAAAERIEAFYLDKGLRTRLRRAAWEHSHAFHWSRVLPRLETWLQETVDRRQGADFRVRVQAV